MIKIAVDTAGGDFGPEKTVYGSCLALAENPDLSCLFYGFPEQIEQALPDFADQSRIEIIAVNEVITDEDPPFTAVRQKQNSSLMQALGAAAAGKADSFVSAGNSGAIYAGSLSLIGTLPGIKRPASVSILPTVSTSSPYYLLIDSGANTSSKPKHLTTYGHLGSKLAEKLFGKPQPKIGLLNIGSEPSKGTAFTKEVYELLDAEADLNFTGNAEPSGLLNGTHDVILTDGFTGNIMLKAVEGTADILLHDLLGTIKSKVKLDAAAKKAIEHSFKTSINRYTNADIGGGFILGIKAPVVITHGAADEVMFQHSVELAGRLADSNVFSC